MRYLIIFSALFFGSIKGTAQSPFNNCGAYGSAQGNVKSIDLSEDAAFRTPAGGGFSDKLVASIHSNQFLKLPDFNVIAFAITQGYKQKLQLGLSVSKFGIEALHIHQFALTSSFLLHHKKFGVRAQYLVPSPTTQLPAYWAFDIGLLYPINQQFTLGLVLFQLNYSETTFGFDELALGLEFQPSPSFNGTIELYGIHPKELALRSGMSFSYNEHIKIAAGGDWRLGSFAIGVQYKLMLGLTLALAYQHQDALGPAIFSTLNSVLKQRP